MPHLFYYYSVSQKDNIEFTRLKWFENGEYENSRSFDKPTSELTSEEIEILNYFFDQGGIIESKNEVQPPEPDPNINPHMSL